MITTDPAARRGKEATRSARGLAALVASALLAATFVEAQPVERDEPRVERHRGDLIHIFSGDVEIPVGTIRDGSVVSVGGRVVIRGEVTRDVVVILGSLEIDGGSVGGSATGVLSSLELRDADVDHDLVNVLGGMTRDNVYIGRELFDLGEFGGWIPGILRVLTWMRIVGLLFVFVLLVLLVAIAPERVRLIGRETPTRYVSALFAGLLAYLVLLLFVAPLALATVVGLPFLVLAYLVIKWLGVAGIFFALGQRLARGFGGEMSPLGAVVLVYSAYAGILLVLSLLGPIGLLAIVLVHSLFFFFFEAPAVGLVLLTRGGTRNGARAAWPSPPAAADPRYPVDPSG